MINNNLIKAIVLVTVMQSLLLVGIEVASYYREQRYIKIIRESQLFDFCYEDFEDNNLDYTPIDELSSKNTSAYA